MAIKKIFDPVIRPELLAELKNEISMLSYLKHAFDGIGQQTSEFMHHNGVFTEWIIVWFIA